MMSGLDLSSFTEAIRVSIPVLIGLALFLAGYGASANDGGPIMRTYFRYISWLERELRMMFIFVTGKRIFRGQVVALYVYLTVHALVGIPYWAAGVPLIIAAPAMWIRSERQKRLARIEDQLDGMILALANALKSTPSVGAAFQSIVGVIQPPISQEIDLAVKEMKVGSTLDQALLHMASRIGSRQVDSALSAILIGRQVGGNLPRVLESTANSMREMRRLEGVVRTKTAEGRVQMWVIGAIPFLVLWGVQKMFPGFFDVLTESAGGYLLIAFAVGCWISSIVLARKVLKVNL